MDALSERSSRLDLDAEFSRLLAARHVLQARQNEWRDHGAWRVALAGCLTGAGLIAGGIMIGLALIRALH
jgi:hypothetical protein